MSVILPPARPQQSREPILALLSAANVRDDVALVGQRGYYLRTMGDPSRNDRGIYDDAIFLVSPNTFAAFNGNVDPSAYRTGIANLQPGLWRYKVGTHGLSRPKSQQYTALVQAGEVTVSRDNRAPETGWFGINIHRGGYSTTSSLGCQTIPPAQWPAFITLIQSELRRCNQRTIPYLLVT